VAREEHHRLFLDSTLTSAGLVVSSTDSFACARARLMAQPPSVLVTEIRLGAHNGLHLALVARFIRPEMAVIVTAPAGYAVLRRDAEALGAMFVPEPVTKGELLAALYPTPVPARNTEAMLWSGYQAGAGRLDEPRRFQQQERSNVASPFSVTAARR
jgi:DNA-binding NtrC family response regulator